MASTKAISRARVAGALAVVVVALGLGACGSGDDNSGQAPAQDEKAAATTTAGDSPGTPREQVKAFILGMQKEFVAGDGESFCNRLTAAGRQDAGKFGELIGRGSTCETMVRETAKASREAGIPQQPPSKIVSIKISGNRATAVLRTSGRPPTTTKLINRDGQWKLPNPGFTKALSQTNG